MTEQTVQSLFETPNEAQSFITIGHTKVRVKPAPVADAKLKVHFELAEDKEISDVVALLPQEYQPNVKDNRWCSYASGASKSETIFDETLQNGDKVSITKYTRVSQERAWQLKKDSEYSPSYYIRKDYDADIMIQMTDKKLVVDCTVNPNIKPILDLIEPLRGKEMRVTWCYEKSTGQSYTPTTTVCEAAIG